MPETRAAIGRSLRSANASVGISPAAVDELLRGAEAQLAGHLGRLSCPGPWGIPTPGRWVDPFPGADRRANVRRELQKVLYLAWADIPDEPVHECVPALLLYEQEHGLRPGIVEVRHREQRRRLRRLAWSMLSVARERHVGKQPDDVLVDVLLGGRRVAVVEHLPDEAAALLVGAGSHEPASLDLAFEYVRAAVRHGRADAPELLGLLRESIARGVRAPVPTSVTAGVATLATILAREQRRVSGVLAGTEVGMLASEAGERLSSGDPVDDTQRPDWTRTLHFGLRATQEMAELHDTLGNTAAAWRALRHMAKLLRHLDVEDLSEWQSWRQQHLQTRSTLARHSATEGRHAEAWLRQAEGDARRSLDLAEDEPTPAGYRLVPSSQLLATSVARLCHHAASGLRPPARLEDQAHQHLARATAVSSAATGVLDRPTHSARLSVARRQWELAILCRGPDEIADARAVAHALLQPCTLRQDLEKLQRLESMSRAVNPSG